MEYGDGAGTKSDFYWQKYQIQPNMVRINKKHTEAFNQIKLK